MGDRAEQFGQGVLPGCEAVRLPDALVRFCQFMALGHDPETGEKLNQTEAAEKAGIGNSKDSARKLASYYMRDERVKNLIARLREDRWQSLMLQQHEVVEGYRELLDKSLGRRKIKRTLVDDEGVRSDVDAYDFRPGEAERALKAMAEITGLLGAEKKQNGSAGGGESAGQGRELNSTERAARVIELLKRARAVGDRPAAAG